MTYKSRNTKSVWGQAKLSMFVIAAALHIAAASAQDAGDLGVISGSVVDAEFGGGIPDVRVAVIGTDRSANTDKDGRYLISGVPVGEHTLIATALFYKSSTVEELSVEGGEIVKIDVPLYADSSDVVELEGFTVKAQALAGSSLALLSDRQRSASISDAIGSESFGRLGIGDAADALSKTTGASIVDGKYVVIRGLSDRYNNTTLNGSSVPSADPDKRAVQLDQFPAGIIESIVTSKSFTPDKSGNFSGGSVNVVTKSIPDAAFMTLSVGFGYNDKTTFDDYLTYTGGGKDWLGMDDGAREVPQVVLDLGSIPNTPVGQPQEQLEIIDEVVRSFSAELAPYAKTAPIDHSVSLAFGDRYPIGDEANGPVIGVIGSLNYKRSFSAYDDGEVGRYEIVGRDLSLGMSQEFTESKGVDEAQWGSVLNGALVLNQNHEVGLKTMYNQSGNDEAIFRTGRFVEAVAQDTFRVRNLHYTERSLSSYQLYGEHRFESLAGMRFDWEVATSKSTQEEPDFRLFYDSIPASPDGRPTYTGNFPAPRRYWRELEEATDEYKFDLTLPFGQQGSSLKFGIHHSETEREFNERAFIYQDNVGSGYDGDASSFLDEDHIGFGEDGRILRFIREFISFVPKYEGTMEVDAAYLMADLRPLERWRVIFGARFEDASIAVQSFQANGDPFTNDGDLRNEDWLPAVQLVRELTENQNLRFAYSETLARPNFRELSPFGSFDNVGGEVFIGNPELRQTLVENVDIRYEWFMEEADLFAVSAFQKRMEDPIELTYREGQLTYLNVPEAEVYGLELEARKRLGFLSGERHEFSVGGNLSFIESQVDRSEVELSDKLKRNPDISPTREMQGQSALIGNLDLLYSHRDSGSSYSLVYNHTGERLYSVSNSALPDIYEEPSDSLDFIFSRPLPRGFSMKFSVKNLLDSEKTKVWSDFDQDLIYSRFSKGRSVSLSFSKRFD